METWCNECWKYKTPNDFQFRSGMLSWNYWAGPDASKCVATPNGSPDASKCVATPNGRNFCFFLSYTHKYIQIFYLMLNVFFKESYLLQ